MILGIEKPVLVIILLMSFAMSVGICIGYYAIPKPEIKVLSYGLNEKENVWNRIRVDEKGHVICSKGEGE